MNFQKIAETASTLATENFYRVRAEKNAKMLDNYLAIASHHAVAQLLFMNNRA